MKCFSDDRLPGAVLCGDRRPLDADIAAIQRVVACNEGRLGIKESREMSGLSRKQAAKLLGWEVAELAAIEECVREPTAEELDALKELCDVPCFDGGASR